MKSINYFISVIYEKKENEIKTTNTMSLTLRETKKEFRKAKKSKNFCLEIHALNLLTNYFDINKISYVQNSTTIIYLKKY